ncbi:MAG: MCP four helix bundle domain-containing protein, partial [Deltaproteobacteria bacterium]
MKLNISKKLFLGYIAMAFLTIISSLYAVVNLRSINSYTNRIIHGNVVVIENSKLLIDNLIDRESALKKFIILKDKSFADLFRSKSTEFRQKLDELKYKQGTMVRRSIDQIVSLNKEYEDIFTQNEEAFAKKGKGTLHKEEVQMKSRILVGNIASEIHKIEKLSQGDIDQQMASINTLSQHTLNVTLALSLFSLVVGIGLAMFLTYN